ncbi:hypothetical protein AZE42_07150 [Rhizopogon vesiculosus]|uniref:Uncharacterized protein n=1 Tax=Rhizopogon vesiculosus TaxID=180088 RepID=A0A1J8QSW6_9AGAM|nr:hypothetical protein AZE42_07150 [Rhizopogon vesiculosus]
MKLDANIASARVREILTIEVNAYASGDRLVPPRSEADISEDVKQIQFPICGKVNDL